MGLEREPALSPTPENFSVKKTPKIQAGRGGKKSKDF